jgi:ankyrin repeat protein
VEHGPRAEQGQSYLELAAYTGALRSCQELVKHGAQVNAQNQSYDGSALAAASVQGKQEVVEFLVKEGGADVSMQLQYGSWGSALAAASYIGRQEVVEFLVKEGGADVNIQLQIGGWGSALAAASYLGRQEVVEFLVKEGGADVNMQLQYDEYGSVLAKAAASRPYDDQIVPTIRLLVNELGAEVNMQLQYGKYANALDAAEKKGTAGMVQLLIELGAEKEERRNKVVEENENETEICD